MSLNNGLTANLSRHAPDRIPPAGGMGLVHYNRKRIEPPSKLFQFS